MPPAALIPLAIGGAALGAAGAGFSAKSGQAGLIRNLPPPAPLFPGLQAQGLSLLSGLAPGAFSTLGQMQATGMPTNVGPAFEALVAAAQPQLQRQQANILGAFGAEGLRFSSPALEAVGQFQSETATNFLSILAQYTLQAQEAAAQRQLSASEFGASAFLGPAFTEYPTAAVVGGQPSVPGSVLSSAGSSLTTIALLSALGI